MCQNVFVKNAKELHVIKAVKPIDIPKVIFSLRYVWGLIPSSSKIAYGSIAKPGIYRYGRFSNGRPI